MKDFLEIFSDPEVMKYCEDPYSLKQAHAFIETHGLKEKPRVFAIEEKRSGKVIGHALFGQLALADDGIYEIGWILNKDYWRKGFAFEMASRLFEYGFHTLGLHKVVAETVDPVKSVSLMKKLNMKEEGIFRKHTTLNDKWYDLYWYGILKSEYKGKR